MLAAGTLDGFFPKSTKSISQIILLFIHVNYILLHNWSNTNRCIYNCLTTCNADVLSLLYNNIILIILVVIQSDFPILWKECPLHFFHSHILKHGTHHHIEYLHAYGGARWKFRYPLHGDPDLFLITNRCSHNFRNLCKRYTNW